MIIGMDEANKINTWVNYEKLIKEHTFVVVDREETARNTDWFINKHIYLRDRYNIIPNISSSELRREIKMDLDFHSDLLNYKVVKYIKRYKLYE